MSEQRDLIPGTIYGYREWTMLNGLYHPVGTLPSSSAPGPWSLDEVNVAEHTDPRIRGGCSGFMSSRCECGFWAKYKYSPTLGLGGSYAVGGVIEAYGKVVLHQDGFRAEKARILAFVRPSWLPQGARLEQDVVPVYDSWDMAYKVYPPPDLTALGIKEKEKPKSAGWDPPGSWLPASRPGYHGRTWVPPALVGRCRCGDPACPAPFPPASLTNEQIIRLLKGE